MTLMFCGRRRIIAATIVALATACGSPDVNTAANAELGGAAEAAAQEEIAADDVALPLPAAPDAAAPFSIWPVAPDTLTAESPAAWTVEVVGLVTHDTAAFTQGLELIDGVIYESAGRYGESSIRTVDPQTGEVLTSAEIAPEYFAEGLTQVGDTLIQLTWREETALRWQLPELSPLPVFRYEGEGWGICLLDDTLVTSDGSERLTRRDPDDFSVLSRVAVAFNGAAIGKLNELECVDGYVLANVWKTDFIIVIDPDSGNVLATIDASPLNGVIDRPSDGLAVLNGIADLGDGTLLLGGKWWPQHAVVRLTAG